MPSAVARTRHALLAGPVAVAVLAAAASSASASAPCAVPGYNDHCESWASVYDDPSIPQGSHQLEPRIATTPDGSRVYVAVIDEALNRSDPYHSPASWQVLAYDGHTGQRLWLDTYQAEGHYDRPNAIAISPDGRTVYATGASYDANVLSATDRDMVTIAYDAATGHELWVSRNRDTAVHDTGTNVVVSRDGSQVYAVADIAHTGGGIDWAAVAYSAADGSVLWRTAYTGVAAGTTNAPTGAALSPAGDLFYVTGESDGTAQYDVDYATVAYATAGAHPGAQAWVSRYDGVGKQLPDRAAGIAVDVAGRVLVTGDSIRDFSASVQDDYATVAYDGQTGQQLWDARYSGPAGGVQFGMDVAASPTAAIAVVSGQSEPSPQSHDTDWATIGYDTATGRQLWVQRLATPGNTSEFPRGAAFTADGASAVIVGYSGGRTSTPLGTVAPGGDGVTVSYAATTGAQQWIARYSAVPTDVNTPDGVAVSGDGTIFVTAQVAHDEQLDTSGTDNQYDVATFSYAAAVPSTSVPEGIPVLLLLLAGGTTGLGFRGRRRRTARAA